jgi:hypothetical protein
VQSKKIEKKIKNDEIEQRVKEFENREKREIKYEF